MSQTVLVAGSTGMVGSNLSRCLVDKGWRVMTLALEDVETEGADRHVALDLTDRDATLSTLGKLPDIDSLFYCTWSPQPTEAENCVVNRVMIRNALDGLANSSLSHVALVTGLKHYLGSFEAYATGLPYTPFQEDQPRLPGPNFYYDQEDELFDAAERWGFSWSVHRPHTLVGHALGNAMNMGVTLAVYASICREKEHPFVFPGSAAQYSAVTDITDARLLADHLAWAATEPLAADTAFNVANGDLFRWERMWSRIAGYFGLTPAPLPEQPRPLAHQMAKADAVWKDIVDKHELAPHSATRLTSWWHTDADLGREIECFTDMRNSRERGFLRWQRSEASFFDLFDRLIEEHVIPDFRSDWARLR
ncbi:SDR family oxidoreductase [Rhodophyticola porphyridii]|uniref:SDR family oxidoreductase n=1 Tax=Rhodophyticola porphyridii TaxID=1852017 RepID=UPI0035D01FF2